MDSILKEAEMSQFLDVHSKSRSSTEHVSFNLIQYTDFRSIVSLVPRPSILVEGGSERVWARD